MPKYDYKCDVCGHDYSETRSVDDPQFFTECPVNGCAGKLAGESVSYSLYSTSIITAPAVPVMPKVIPPSYLATSTFAVLKGITVTKIITAGSLLEAEESSKAKCVRCTDKNPAQVGWTYDETTNTFNSGSK